MRWEGDVHSAFAAFASASSAALAPTVPNAAPLLAVLLGSLHLGLAAASKLTASSHAHGKAWPGAKAQRPLHNNGLLMAAT